MNEPERDIRRLWQGQPREEQVMSIDEIRSRAARFEQRVRRWGAVGGGLFALILVVESWQVWRTPELPERVGDLLTMAALVYYAYRIRPHMTMEAMPAGLGLTSSDEFYRTQLARQRELASHPWRWLVLFMPGVGLSIFGDALSQPIAQTAAIAALGVALFLWAAWVNGRTARKLQREIDELR
jgi:hypothetical protein